MRPLVVLVALAPTTARAGEPCGALSLDDADAVVLGDGADDRVGWAVTGLDDVDGDGRSDLLVGAPGVDGRTGEAAVIVDVSGTEWFSDHVTEEPSVSSGEFGAAVVSLGRGVAWPRIGVAAPDAYGTAAQAGIVYLYDAAWLVDEDASLELAATIVGDAASQYTGYALANAGDVDRDGAVDLLVGAPGDATAGGDAGAAWLFEGPLSGTLTPGDARAALLGEAPGDRAGWAVSEAGDLDKDGFVDVVVGAPQAGDGGATYVVEGPVSGVTSLASATAILRGDDDERLGWSIAGVGDVNKDGWRDLLVGAPGADHGGADAGVAYLFLGPILGSLTTADADAVLLGTGAGDQAGFAVAAPGDVNRDGYADLLIGAPGADEDGVDGGAAYLVLGPVAGVVPLSAADGIFAATAPNAQAGWSVAPAGDVDGDGYPDLLVGAYADPTAGVTAGAAFVVGGGACPPVDDRDRDGSPDVDDCADDDAAVHPGADEDPCNGVDDDCDGSRDEGDLPTWYADEDGDGWGAGDAVVGCEAPSNAAAIDGDCDDADASVHPGQTEACNDVDDDCDDDVDEGCDTGHDTDAADTDAADTDAPADTDVDTEPVPTRADCGCEGRGTGGTWTALVLLLGVPWRRASRRRPRCRTPWQPLARADRRD